MNQYHEERNFLLYVARSGVSKRQKSGPLNRSDFAAVYTPPTNNPIPFAGPCLIWRHGLNDGGYGTMKWNEKTHLTHRVAYEMSRGDIPIGKHVLHLCHRRCCIQPAHLYAGTPKDNQEDKDIRLAKGQTVGILSLFFDKYQHLLRDGMKCYWDEPASNQPSFLPPEHHQCKYTIPAGRIKLCQTCFKPEPHMFSDLGRPDYLGVETKHRNCVRKGLDERAKGRSPGDDPLNFVPAYNRIALMQTSTQL